MSLEIPSAAHDTTHHPPARGGAGLVPSHGRVAHVGKRVMARTGIGCVCARNRITSAYLGRWGVLDGGA